MTKRNKTIYWISTLWLASGMLATGTLQLFKAKAEGALAPPGVYGITHLGFPIYFLTKWGIYLTQVTPRCSIAFHGGLSAKSGRIRSPLLHREGMPGVFGPASVAGWFSLSTMRGAEGVVGE